MSESPAACEVIAEAGVNHNGREDLALALVEAAAASGADCVKFQTFDPDDLTAATAPTAAYQAEAGAGANQKAMLEALSWRPRPCDGSPERRRTRASPSCPPPSTWRRRVSWSRRWAWSGSRSARAN